MTRSLSLVALSLSLAACGGGGSDSSDNTPSTPAPASYTVEVTTSAGGSASVTSRAVTEGNTLAITFTADSGYTLTGVEGCDGTLEGNTYTTGAITAGCTVNGEFAAVDTTVNITSATMTGGMIYPASLTAEQGDTVQFTLVPDVTNMVETVSGCDGELKGNIYAFTASESCEISASFTAQSDTTTRNNTGAQKTLVLPVAFAGRDAIDNLSVDDLTTMFISSDASVNQYVVEASEGSAWLEPHILPYYTLTSTNTASNGSTSGFTYTDAEVLIGDAQRQEIYSYIAANVEDYTSYDRLITVINDNPNQPYVCYASLNHSAEIESWDHYVAHTASACASKATFVHQLGHTFGMRHTTASQCENLPAETFAYRSTEDCETDGEASPFPMGELSDHDATYTATMRNLAGWIDDSRQAIVTAPANVTLSQSSSPDGGVQLVRIPYALDANGDAVYVNFELKTNTGLDASLFTAKGVEDNWQLLVSIPQTRTTSAVSSPLDALYLMPDDDDEIGINEDYLDRFRGMSVRIAGTQGSGKTLTVDLDITPPVMLPQPALSVLAGDSTAETTIVTLTNTSASAISGITESLAGLNPSHFTVQSSTCAGSSLAANASCQVVVARTSTNPAFATLRFAGNADQVQQAEIEAIAINEPYDSAAALEWMTLSDYPRMSLFEAVAFCEAREDNGNTDWRVPSAEELNAAFTGSATPPLDLTSATYDRYFWSKSVEADLSMSTLAVINDSYSMANSPRSAVRHVVCTRTQ
ncbi:MAG: hypothetical protein CL587_16625 [Alteromonadaceae bacterium]|nr:hypothetical protein [Alteromonadaceae bacterium]